MSLLLVVGYPLAIPDFCFGIRLFERAPVLVCGPTRRLPGHLGYHGYYDNSIGRCVCRPNQIRWRRTLPNRRLLRQVSAEWTPLPADCSDYFLRPGGGSVAIGVTPPRPAESLWKKTDPTGSPPPPAGKPPASAVSRRVFSLARPLGRSLVYSSIPPVVHYTFCRSRGHQNCVVTGLDKPLTQGVPLEHFTKGVVR